MRYAKTHTGEANDANDANDAKIDMLISREGEREYGG
jgi:hypothetical protein